MVIMNRPGVWILGDVDDQVRNRGLGIVIEYENRNQGPQWIAPPRKATWDYTIFGNAEPASEPAETIPLVFRRKFAGNHWVDH
jgi:hypothetical protein